MSKSGSSLLRGAHEALDHARGAKKNPTVHIPKRQARFVEELSEADLEAIARAEIPPGHDHLDLECED
jgi:hypothetical protein